MTSTRTRTAWPGGSGGPTLSEPGDEEAGEEGSQPWPAQRRGRSRHRHSLPCAPLSGLGQLQQAAACGAHVAAAGRKNLACPLPAKTPHTPCTHSAHPRHPPLAHPPHTPRYELPTENLKGRVEIKFFDNVSQWRLGWRWRRGWRWCWQQRCRRWWGAQPASVRSGRPHKRGALAPSAVPKPTAPRPCAQAAPLPPSACPPADRARRGVQSGVGRRAGGRFFSGGAAGGMCSAVKKRCAVFIRGGKAGAFSTYLFKSPLLWPIRGTVGALHAELYGQRRQPARAASPTRPLPPPPRQASRRWWRPSRR
jgi:hypothetical protein